MRTTPAGDNHTDKENKDPHGRKPVPATQKPSRIKPLKKKNGGEKVSLWSAASEVDVQRLHARTTTHYYLNNTREC